MDSNPKSEKQDGDEVSGQPDCEEKQAAPEVTFDSPVLESHPTHSDKIGAQEVERNWRDDWDNRGKPIVEIVGLIFLIVYAVFTILIYRATGNAATAADKSATAAVASLRPWLKIDDLALRKIVNPRVKTLMFLSAPGPGALQRPFLNYEITVENVGHSVAQKVNDFPDFFVAPFDSGKWNDLVTNAEQRSCQSQEKRTSDNAIIVFPGETRHLIEGIEGPPLGDGYAVELIVCINYVGADGTSYQTQARAELDENRRVTITPGFDASSNALRLVRDPGGDYAN